MNIDLIDSFGHNYPEENDGSLDCISMAIVCQFNRFGTLLAVGCNDGRIVIWDFWTRGIAKIITGHVHPVCSISWSRTGRKLISASTDNNVSLWQILTGECEQRFRFPSPVLKVQFHPRREHEVLVCPMKHAPVILDLRDGSHKLVPMTDDEGDTQVVAAYDHRGQHIFTGNAKGKVCIFTADNELTVLKQFRVSAQVSSTTAIKSIEFARRSKSFLVNTADRMIRVYKMRGVLDGENDPEPDQKLQDLVNKTMWKKCCFSGDGEFVCAGSARQHALYIWEKATGTLMKILHGTKGEILLDVVWHPCRPIVASISQGVVTIWAQQQVENWSAFAPDFKELDENVDYDERESEFDLEDEDKSEKDGDEEEKVDGDGVLEIDVDTNAAIPAYCSSDEEGEDPDSLLHLPIAPDVEEPEEHFVPGVDSEGDGADGASASAGASAGGEPVAGPSSSAVAKRAAAAAEAKENASPAKKKRVKVTEVQLANAPQGEVHPMVSKSGAKDKAGPSGTKRPSGRPKAKDKNKGKN